MFVSSQSKQTLGLDVSSEMSCFMLFNHSLVILQRKSQFSQNIQIWASLKGCRRLNLASGLSNRALLKRRST